MLLHHWCSVNSNGKNVKEHLHIFDLVYHSDEWLPHYTTSVCRLPSQILSSYQNGLINPWDSIHQWRCMYNYNGVYNIDSSEQISLPDSENMMGHHYNGRTPAVEGHRTGEWGCSTSQPPPKWDGKSQTLKLHAPPPLERWPHLHGGWVVEQGCFLVGNN